MKFKIYKINCNKKIKNHYKKIILLKIFITKIFTFKININSQIALIFLKIIKHTLKYIKFAHPKIPYY